MKISIDITQIQYQGTGVGNYTYNLVDHLLKLDATNDYLLFGGSLRDFVSLNNIAANFSQATKKIFPLPPTLQDLIFNRLHSIPIETFTGHTDVFHASDWTHPPTNHSQTVTTIHDLTTIKFPAHQHPKTIAVQNRRLHWATKEASAIIADSESTKKNLIKTFNLPDNSIHVVHLAPDQSITDFAKLSEPQKNKQISAIKSKYNLTNFILSVGTQEPRKNLTQTIQAFQQSNLNLELAIAGKFGWGPKQPPVKGINILGFIPRQDLPALYAAASAFVYPSLYEGFGLPVLEAMTLGIPVVTTNKGSLQEVAGQAAVLVNPNSTKSISIGIKQALTNPKPLVSKGLKQASKFSWNKTAQQTLAIYEKVAGQKP